MEEGRGNFKVPTYFFVGVQFQGFPWRESEGVLLKEHGEAGKTKRILLQQCRAPQVTCGSGILSPGSYIYCL